MALMLDTTALCKHKLLLENGIQLLGINTNNMCVSVHGGRMITETSTHLLCCSVGEWICLSCVIDHVLVVAYT